MTALDIILVRLAYKNHWTLRHKERWRCCRPIVWSDKKVRPTSLLLGKNISRPPQIPLVARWKFGSCGATETRTEPAPGRSESSEMASFRTSLFRMARRTSGRLRKAEARAAKSKASSPASRARTSQVVRTPCSSKVRRRAAFRGYLNVDNTRHEEVAVSTGLAIIFPERRKIYLHLPPSHLVRHGKHSVGQGGGAKNLKAFEEEVQVDREASSLRLALESLEKCSIEGPLTLQMDGKARG